MQDRNLIGSEWISASSKETAVTNPATNEKISSVPNGGAAELRHAIAAAAEALPGAGLGLRLHDGSETC